MAALATKELTDQQHRAITTRDVSVGLSAGAGCGKTRVLTERFLWELDPAHHPAEQAPRLGELIAITFTERAAREMRQRIREACRGRLLEAEDHQSASWLQILRELDSARISTIHSFCAALLRSHAVEAGLDPHFEILERAQTDMLLFELIDDELRRRLAERDEAVIELVVEFGFERLRDMVARLLNRRHHIDAPVWHRMTPERLMARWETYRREQVLPVVTSRVAESREARTLLAIVQSHPSGDPTMRDRCRALLDRIGGLSSSDDPLSDLETIRENARVQGSGAKSDWPSQVYDEFKSAAESLRKGIDRAGRRVAFDMQSARPAAEASLQLLAVAREVAEVYEVHKRQLGVLDFDDLLIHARRLLTAPEHRELRRRLASNTRLLLVDEFQDTDPLQTELCTALVGEGLARGKLFFVGDYKQSIYRFRGADPHVFRDLCRRIPPKGRKSLTVNFRSQPAILRFVNALFCEDLGPDYERLVAQRPQVSAEPAVELLWAPDPAPDQRAGQAERLRRQEADWIARRIRSMLEAAERIVWDDEAAECGKPAVRAVKEGDVAMLFRALSDVQYYEEALRRYDIPYYLVGGHAFYAQQEIYDLLNLLRALASGCDEVSLAGALRGPMFSLEDETLFWLAQHPDGLVGGLFAESPPAELTSQERRRVEHAATILRRLRAVKDRLPVAELINLALEWTAYDAVVLAELLGQRKLANLRKLIDQARSFDRSGVFSLADFITQLSEFVARQPEEPLAATHPESTDVVRLMTIHQAKGLEFPVVIVPDLDRSMRGPTVSVAFTPELGPAAKLSSSPSGIDLFNVVETQEEQAELVRLLYVATTRAADYLVLSSGVQQLGRATGPWTRLVHRRFDPRTGELQARLPAGWKTPGVKVTTAPPPVAGERPARAGRHELAKVIDKAVRLAETGRAQIPKWLPPVPFDPAARRQFSFSRLSGHLKSPLPTAEHAGPPGAEDSPLTAHRVDRLGMGSLIHAVLAQIELDQPDRVDHWVRCLATRHLPHLEDALDEPIGLVRGFLASSRAGQIAAADEVYRELEFLLAWPPPGSGWHAQNEVMGVLTSDHAVGSAQGRATKPHPSRYLQGFIDCLYLDAAGQWHLLDYKTNQVTASDLPMVAAAYEAQLFVYALAAEQILGRPPAEVVLCFLRGGLEHPLHWDQPARRRLLEMVSQSMAQIVEGPPDRLSGA